MTPGALPGLAWPIIQAPMAGAQDSALAIAVSAAGGLGSLPAAMLDGPTLCDQLRTIRGATTRPVNVNFFCHRPPSPQPARERRWRRRLAPYYAEYPLGEAVADGPARRPFDAAAAEIVEAFRPAVVSFHFGLPEAPLLARVRATGARIFASATTLAEAQWLERRGVDAIIAQGLEAGGHRGSFLADDLSLQLGTLALVPQVVRAVRVPVIAAGGIAGPSGVAAALALGACAAQVGTAYLLCPQATTGALHRQALVSAGAHHTVLTNLFSGRPARGIVNRLIRELGPIDARLPEFPLPAGPLLPLRRAAEALGRDDFSPLWAGQNVQGCRALDAGLQTRWLAGG